MIMNGIMVRLAVLLLFLSIPYWVSAQAKTSSEGNFEFEGYFDPYFGITNKKGIENTPGSVNFSYGAGLNINWKLWKRFTFRAGLAFHSESFVKKVWAPCDALRFSCLSVREIQNQYVEVPLLVQYQLSEQKSPLNTYLTAGFIHQVLVHEKQTAYTADRDIKRAGPERSLFNYFGGDLYLGFKVTKRLPPESFDLFIEPNLRLGAAAFENGGVRYTDKTYPRLGLRTGILF